MKNPILLFLICLFAFSCNEEANFTTEEVAIEEDQDTPDRRTIQNTRAAETYIEFPAGVPNTISRNVSAPVHFDLTISARDCCISDDVVQIWVDGCYIASVDSRGFPNDEHPGESHIVEGLSPGTHTVSYINTISGPGISGWYVEESRSASTTVVIDGCDTGVADRFMPSCRNFTNAIAQCAVGAKNHGKFVSCVAHLTNTWLELGWITDEEKDAIVSCAAQSDLP